MNGGRKAMLCSPIFIPDMLPKLHISVFLLGPPSNTDTRYQKIAENTFEKRENLPHRRYRRWIFLSQSPKRPNAQRMCD
jgi:hypothetical protein